VAVRERGGEDGRGAGGGSLAVVGILCTRNRNFWAPEESSFRTSFLFSDEVEVAGSSSPSSRGSCCFPKVLNHQDWFMPEHLDGSERMPVLRWCRPR
jgi:hypothetical protein